MFETFDHTADMGLRIQADSLNQLFEQAALGLFSLIVKDINSIAPKEQFQLTIAGTDLDYLLFDWLRELLYRWEVHQQLCCSFQVTIDKNGLQATIHGESLDPARHSLVHEVKAITYHGLEVKQIGNSWEAELIVDI